MHLIIPLLVLGLAEYLPYSLLLNLVQKKTTMSSMKTVETSRILFYTQAVGRELKFAPLLFSRLEY